MRKFIIFLALLCASVPAFAQVKYRTLSCAINHVDDGDTIFCSVKRGQREIAYRFEIVGIDAPERGDITLRWHDQPHWEEATDALAELVLNKVVTIQLRATIAPNAYRARVYVTHQRRPQDVGLLMLMAGHAWRDPLTSRTLTANEQAIYAQAQGEAIVNKRGLWKDKDTARPISPRQWRKGEK